MSDKIILKRCGKCKEIKPISEFYKNRTHKDRHQSECKVCWSEYQKAYSQTQRGKESQSRRSAHYLKTEKGKEINARYKQTKKGKESHRRSNAHYQQSEKGRKIRAVITNRYHSRHPEYRKAINAVNHAIRAGRLPRPNSLPCHYCPAQAKEYHHHKGYEPEHWLDVIPVCIKCHNKIPKNPVKPIPSLTA